MNRYVYFIQFGDNGDIKIGVSNEPEKRLKQLQTGSPKQLKLLGTLRGGEIEEKRLHETFKKFHLRGEWFEPATEIFIYISRLQNNLETTICSICEMEYLPNIPDDLIAHEEYHKTILQGSLPYTVREFMKKFGWEIVHNSNEYTKSEVKTAKKAIAFSWWARAREFGIPDSELDEYIRLNIKYIEASGEQRAKINDEIKQRWGDY